MTECHPNWRDHAACKDLTDLFFPARGASTREAKEVCRACPVRQACLDYALLTRETFGIWGGLSERERRRLRGEYPEKVQKPIVHGTRNGYNVHRRRGETPCAACKAANALGRARARERANPRVPRVPVELRPIDGEFRDNLRQLFKLLSEAS